MQLFRGFVARAGADRGSGGRNPHVVSLFVLLSLFTAVSGSAQTLWWGRAEVEVKVKAEKGAALSGAQVTFRYLEARPVDGPPSVATNQEGKAKLIGLAEGRWHVEVVSEGYRSYLASVRIRLGKKVEILSSAVLSQDGSGGSMRVGFSKARKGKAGAPPAPPPLPAPVPVPEPIAKEPSVEPEQTAAIPLSEPEQTVPAPQSEPEKPPPVPPPVPEHEESPEPERVEPTPPSAPESPELPAPSPAPDADQALAEPVIAKPVPVEPEPVEPEPVEPEPVEPVPVEPEPVEPEPAEPEPVEPEPVEPEPAEPEPAEPEPAEPEPAEPEPAEPVPAEPEPAEPEPAEAVSADPVPAEPGPAESAQPAPPKDAVPKQPESQQAPSSPEQPSAPMPVPAPPRVEVEEPQAVVKPPAPPLPTGPKRALKARSGRGCPDCRPGEQAVTLEVTVAASDVSQACPEDLDSRIREVVGLAVDEGIESFLGALLDPATRDLGGELDPAASAQARELLEGISGIGPSCRLLAVVLPRKFHYSGYRYGARDVSGTGDCPPSDVCRIGKCSWQGNPRIVRRGELQVIYGTFSNRSPDRIRHPALTIYFER